MEMGLLVIPFFSQNTSTWEVLTLETRSEIATVVLPLPIVLRKTEAQRGCMAHSRSHNKFIAKVDGIRPQDP